MKIRPHLIATLHNVWTCGTCGASFDSYAAYGAHMSSHY